jgi:hypothetical protein
VKSLSSVVSANRVVAGGWIEGAVFVGGARERRSVVEEILTCDSETLQNSHMN